MAEFNPDEYLKSTSTKTSAFNPDEYLKISQPKQPSFLDKAQRQLGLTGRYLTEGIVGTGDVITSPIRALQNAIMPESLQAQPLSQVLTRNLPQPANATERMVGDVSRSLVSTAVPMGLAGLTKPVSAAGQLIQQALTSNAPTQAASAIGGGLGVAAPRELGMGTTAQTIGGLIGGAAGGLAVAPKSLEAPVLAPKEKTIKQSIEAGYQIPPTQAGGTKFQKFLETMGGKPKTEQDAQFHNQEITNKLAKKYIGLSESDNLGTDAIQAVKEKYNPVYEQVSKLPSITQTEKQTVSGALGVPKEQTVQNVIPSGRQLLDDLKQTRADSKGYWDFWKRTGDPAAQKQALQFDSKANQLESQLEELAKYHKKPDLINELKNARRELAKAHTVNKAMNPATGDISANVFKSMLGKVPLSGEAKTIADFASGFGKIARVPIAGEPTNFNILDAAMAFHGVGTGNAPETLFPLLRKPARMMALRKGAQESLLQRQGTTSATPVVPYGSLLDILNRQQ
jgi:hypothetical protein